MNGLELMRLYNMKLYELNNMLDCARFSAYPKSVTYDSIGGSHGQAVNQIEKAYERADKIVSRIIRTKGKRDVLAEKIKRAAYRSEITEQEWFTVTLYYIITKGTGQPYRWSEVVRCLRDVYAVGDRQAYNYRRSACNKILDNLE